MLYNLVVNYILSVRSRHCYLWLAALVGMALALMLPVSIALAGPVAPTPVKFTQPDGTVIVASPFGDEWYSGYEYQGHTILLDSRSGYWVYAQLEKDGRLTPGLRKAGIDPLPTVLSPHLRDRQTLQAREVAGAQLTPNSWPGVSGAQKTLVILADFTPSVSRGTTDAAWNQMFFDATAGAKTVRNFYRQASFDKFDLEPAAETYGSANDGVIAVALNYAHPNPYPSDVNNRWITHDALVAADSYIDYSSFDTNGNGSLDGTELHLVIVVRGFEKSYGGASGSCGPSVWGHRGALTVGGTPPAPTLDGVVVAASNYDHGYSQVGEWHEYSSDGCDGGYPGHMATIGIMVHEMGHDIDWPDLYDTDGSSAGVGYWSIMSGGSWGRASSSEWVGTTPTLPDAFLKWYQGWITPTPIVTPLSGATLRNSAEYPEAYLLGVNPGGINWDFKNASGTGEYFLVENRQLVGFDTGLWRVDSVGNAKGCIIWHIDETRDFTNAANTNETRRLVDVEEANGTPQQLDLPSGSGGNGGDTGDPWPGNTGNTVFSDTSNPNSHWYDGSTSGIAIANIARVGDVCTMDIIGVGPTWDGSDSSNWDMASNWSTDRAPNQNDNTVISSGAPNWPNVNAAASVYNLNILDSAHMNATADVALDVYGNWTELGSGYFEANAGTVVFRGSYDQSIAAGSSSHFHHLQIGNGSTKQTVIVDSDLDVTGNLTFQSGAGLALGSHILRVAGDWTEAPLSFDPGGGTVILDGAVQTVQKSATEVIVYESNLSSTAGWAIHDANGDGWTWFWSTSTSAPNSPDSGQHARHQKNFGDSTIPADDWLFSPGFDLQAGVTYAIRFNHGARSASFSEKLAVYVGADQTVGAMTTSVFDNNNIVNTTWQQGSGTFTPGSSGVYYLGFHAYSDANKYAQAIDDIVVAALDPDLHFYNLTVASDSTATLANNAAVGGDLAVASGGALMLETRELTVEGAVMNQGALAQTRIVNGVNTAFLNLKNAAGTLDKYWGAVINPGGSNLGSTTVTIWGDQYCSGVTEGVLRCFELDPATPQTAAVTFYYTEAERNGTNNATMNAYHWDGSTWELETGAITRGGNGDSQWVQVTGVDAYSPFALNNGNPTAVEIASFTATPQGGTIRLNWETASEMDRQGYNLYRSEPAGGELLLLNATLIPAQNPGSPLGTLYTWLDETVPPGVTFSYWLEAVNIHNGTMLYGPVAATVAPGGWFVVYLPFMSRGR